MFKLIKYEFKANFKEFIGILISIIIANLLLLTRRGVWEYSLIMGISITIAIVAIVIIFLVSIKFMSRYMYEDTGYLLLTLPQSGYSILGSRLIIGLLETVAVGIVAYLFIDMNLSYDYRIKTIISESVTMKTLILSAVISCIRYIYMMTMIYFSIVAGKVAFRNKKIGKFGSFIVFIIISILDGYVGTKIQNAFPKEITMGKFMNGITYNINKIESVNEMFSTNIAATTFEVIIFAALFFGTVYLIDNKVDL